MDSRISLTSEPTPINLQLQVESFEILSGLSVTCGMSWLEDFDRLPPFLCVGLANGRRGITVKELTARSGLPYSRVRRIAQQMTWAQITIYEAQKFSSACGIDLGRQKADLRYLRRTAATKRPMPKLKWSVRRLVLRRIGT